MSPDLDGCAKRVSLPDEAVDATGEAADATTRSAEAMVSSKNEGAWLGARRPSYPITSRPPRDAHLVLKTVKEGLRTSCGRRTPRRGRRETRRTLSRRHLPLRSLVPPRLDDSMSWRNSLESSRWKQSPISAAFRSCRYLLQSGRIATDFLLLAKIETRRF